MAVHGYPRKPRPDERVTEHVQHGPWLVPVVDAWRGTREVRTVEEVLTSLRPQYLEGLRAVRFVNGLVRDPVSGRVGAGGWRRGFDDILLSRGSRWNWASEDPVLLDSARRVLWHELGHHVYNRHMSAREFEEWLEARAAPLEPGSGRTERFAEQFEDHLAVEGPEGPLNRFFGRFRL